MEKAQIIITAINSIDASSIKTEEAFEKAVAKRALTINKLLSDDSLASRILDAVKIYATVTKIEFEQSSQRYKVYFIADNSEDQTEEMIRTDRVDGGLIMSDKYLNGLKDRRVCIYKINEKSDNKRIGAGYRIAPLIEPARC